MQNKGIILESYQQIKDIFEQNNVKKPFVGCGKSFQQTEIFEYLKQFKNAKKWVNSNQYRFSFDLQGFLESWKI